MQSFLCKKKEITLLWRIYKVEEYEEIKHIDEDGNKALYKIEEILDNTGSSELSANLFRISQTEQLLERQKEKSEKQASDKHYIVGKTIRETIKQLGNPMPEELPTPNKSIKELERIQDTQITKE